MKTVGVIGLGSVGWSLIHGLSLYYRCFGYDILGDYKWDDILKADIVFICVSTPLGTDGRLDCGNIDVALRRLSQDGYKGIVAIKSTIRIGYMEEATSEFPDLRMVYMPEFLRERDSYTWFLKPDRIVVSGERSDVTEALSYFSWAKDAKILKMDHRSAEIGKLAHNAFIATKVSFTNEIELICSEHAGNPHDVMSVIWADRRVKSKDHLTPGLGPFGGKCVPKDTHDLIKSTDRAILLRAVEEVNKNIEVPEKEEMPEAVVVVPTRNRPEKLDRALGSVREQTVKPRKVIVVSDCDKHNWRRTEDVVGKYSKNLDIELMRNSRAANVSGAINTGIDSLTSAHGIQDHVYVAILDDDDWWDRRYLENMLKYARETGSEWILSGLIRYDQNDPEGLPQDIPERIDMDDFLVGNPNIQGSNLFVKLGRLEAIGGFDEDLPSTTDRDVCIRLLETGNVSYAVLRNHMVHHDAFPRDDRLSYPGSERKKEGLTRFYEKHISRMGEQQRAQFRKRASELFDVDIGGSE
ncbi:MAG: glycosyltransferase [Thermoplasmata archaeon]